MKRKQRNFPLLAIILGFCLLLAGCGPADELANAELAPATIRWVTWESNNTSEAQLMRQFQEEYPQIDFDRSSSYLSTEMLVSATPHLI